VVKWKVKFGDRFRQGAIFLVVAFLAVAVALGAGLLRAADAGIKAEAGALQPSPGPEHHALPQNAVEIARPFGFPITNSMLVSWIAAAGLIIFAQATTRKMQLVPKGGQNFCEWLVESLYNLL